MYLHCINSVTHNLWKWLSWSKKLLLPVGLPFSGFEMELYMFLVTYILSEEIYELQVL